jgi:DNA-binding NarL/FixJ family response regulator
MPNGHPIAVLLAAHETDRRAYGMLLRDVLGLDVAAEIDFKPVAVWEALRMRPELMILLADRLQPSVREVLHLVRRLQRDTRLVAISGLDDPPLLQTWAQCGLDGFILKSGGTDELKLGLRTLLAGRRFLSPSATPVFELAAQQQNGTVRLSRRELELLPMLARGLTLREAARHMTVSYKTADSYRTSLLRKLGVRDRVELARYAIREGIIDA